MIPYIIERYCSTWNTPQIIVNSYINIGEILIIQNKNQLEEIIPHFTQALGFLELNEDKIEEKDIFLTVINYRLGDMLKVSNDKKSLAIEHLEKAFLTGKSYQKPSILLSLDSC